MQVLIAGKPGSSGNPGPATRKSPDTDGYPPSWQWREGNACNRPEAEHRVLLKLRLVGADNLSHSCLADIVLGMNKREDVGPLPNKRAIG